MDLCLPVIDRSRWFSWDNWVNFSQLLTGSSTDSQLSWLQKSETCFPLNNTSTTKFVFCFHFHSTSEMLNIRNFNKICIKNIEFLFIVCIRFEAFINTSEMNTTFFNILILYSQNDGLRPAMLAIAVSARWGNFW